MAICITTFTVYCKCPGLVRAGVLVTSSYAIVRMANQARSVSSGAVREDPGVVLHRQPLPGHPLSDTVASVPLPRIMPHRRTPWLAAGPATTRSAAGTSDASSGGWGEGGGRGLGRPWRSPTATVFPAGHTLLEPGGGGAGAHRGGGWGRCPRATGRRRAIRAHAAACQPGCVVCLWSWLMTGAQVRGGLS